MTREELREMWHQAMCGNPDEFLDLVFALIPGNEEESIDVDDEE